MRTNPASFALVLAFLLMAGHATRADGRLMAVEENDTFASNDDRHYTQGLRFSWLPGNLAPGQRLERAI